MFLNKDKLNLKEKNQELQNACNLKNIIIQLKQMTKLESIEMQVPVHFRAATFACTTVHICSLSELKKLSIIIN